MVLGVGISGDNFRPEDSTASLQVHRQVANLLVGCYGGHEHIGAVDRTSVVSPRQIEVVARTVDQCVSNFTLSPRYTWIGV